MVRIDHNRPILRYLDNLNRERRKLNSLPAFAQQSSSQPRKQPRRLDRGKDEPAYQRVLQSFEALSDEAKIAIDRLLNCADKHLQTQIALFQSLKTLGNRKKKEASERAFEELRDAARKFNAVCRKEMRDGKSPPREWLARLRVSMGSEWQGFEDLDELIRRERN